MKRLIFTLISFAMLASCSTDNIGENAPVLATSKISVEVTPEPTRTYTDGSQIFWAESGEQLNIIYFADDNSSSRRQTATHTDYTLTDNRILFTADFSATDGATSYTLGAYYPYVYKYTTSSISLTVPQDQTPAENSYDPATDILVSTNPVTVQGTPDKVNFTFSRLVAFAKMTLVGITAGEKIESIVFSSPAKPNGAVDFKVHEQGTVENAKWYNNNEDTNLNMNGRIATGEDTVWFTTVPTDLSGSEFTVTVTTDQSVYTKSVDLTGKTLNFERANIAQFRVKDLVKAEKPEAYKLLTDIAQLNAGDRVVFCSKKVESSTAKLLSTTADGSALKFTSSVIVTNALEISPEGLPEDAALFTVEYGTAADTFSFKAAEGYLYGTYENYENKLSFKEDKDDEASWEVSLNSSSYVAKVYNPTHERYLNNSYGTKFNFPMSLSSNYYYIYVIDGQSSEEPVQPVEKSPLATPAVTATVAGDIVTLSWEAVEGAKNYTVSYNGNTLDVEQTSVALTLEYETEYTFSVVANPTDTKLYTASEAGVATVTTEKEPVKSPLATPAVTATVAGDIVTLSWEAVEGAKNYTVSYNGNTLDVEQTSATLDLEYDTEYTFSVVANPADTKFYTASEAGVATVTTEEEPVKSPLATPAVTAEVTGKSVVLSWAAVEGAKNYTVAYNSVSFKVEDTFATLEQLEYNTEYTFSVVANPTDTKLYTASAAGTVTVTTEKEPEQPATEAQTVTLSFPIEGAVSGNEVGTLYEGDVLISSTGTWRTDKVDGRDCIFIGRTTKHELRIEAQNGKTITKVTLAAPVGYLVDLKGEEYDGYTTTTFSSTTEATWTGECKSRLVFTAAGSSHSNIASIVVEYK